MKSLLTSRRFWKVSLLVMLFVGVATLGYTMARQQSTPTLPDEMVMPLISAKSGETATQDLVQNFTRARNLSEVYMMETEQARLVSIEAEFDRHISAIDEQLSHMATNSEDEGLNILLANLMRLKNRFQRDAKTSFRQHRETLGIGG